MSPLSEQGPGWSLQKRLVLAFGVLLILFLGLAGFVLDRAYTQSVEAAVAERLRLQRGGAVDAFHGSGGLDGLAEVDHDVLAVARDPAQVGQDLHGLHRCGLAHGQPSTRGRAAP